MHVLTWVPDALNDALGRLTMLPSADWRELDTPCPDY